MIFTEYLEKYDIPYTEGFDTSTLSTIKAGGKANAIVYPRSRVEFVYAVRLAHAFGERYKVIGGCSNTMFSDNGYDGVILSTRSLNGINVLNSEIHVEAGASLARVIRVARDNEISLVPELFGIPGSIGGAVRNNAGAFGKEISDVFEEGEFLDECDLSIKRLCRDDLGFSYRSSLLQNEKLIFLRGRLRGNAASAEQILGVMRTTARERRERHPKKPSLGSFFKRMGEIYPSRLIDEAGLKGMRIGGACVSEKHAGFIVNLGGAGTEDINLLANTVEDKIRDLYGLRLIRETELVF